jgi:TP901 family phage tail tape measure protein
LANKIIDATLRFVDDFTKPMNKALGTMARHSSEFTKAGKNITKTGKNIQKVGSSLTKTATVPIVGMGVAAVKTAADFESGMSKVQSISGASGKNMGKLTEKAKEMGAKTKFSASESADAFSYMAMAGWKTKDMLKGIEGTMYLAGATGEDLAQTSDIVTDSLSAFGLKAKDTNRFVNVLAKTASSSNTDVGKMGESFKYVAPAAGALGYSVEDTAKALGLMANSGIKASQAGTSLNSWLTRMAKPTKESQAAMDKLGISLTDKKGKMKSFGQITKETRTAFAGLTKSEKAQYAAMLAGKTGMSGLLAVVNSSDKDFNKLSKSIDNSSGAAKKMYDVANNNLKGGITVLKSTIESIAITFGQKLMPIVKKGTNYIQKLANKFNSLSDSQVETIIKTTAIVAVVGPAITIFGGLVTKIGTTISMFGTLGKTFKTLNKAEKIGKIVSLSGGIAVVALIALIAAGIALYKNWDKVVAKAKQLGKWIQSIFNKCGLNVGSFVKGAKSKFTEFVAKVQEFWTLIKPLLNALGQLFKTVFLVRLGAFVGGAIGLFGSLIKSAGDVVSGLVTAFGGIIDFISGVFTGNWRKAWNGVKNIFGGIFSSLVALVKTPMNAVISLINGAIAGINKLGVKIPKWVPGLGGKKIAFNIPTIPMLYKGTDNWAGGPAMVHDKGAEIIDLPKGSRVYPHDKSIQMAKAEGKKNVIFKIEKLCEKIIVRNDEDIDKIADALAKRLEEAAVNMA